MPIRPKAEKKRHYHHRDAEGTEEGKWKGKKKSIAPCRFSPAVACEPAGTEKTEDTETGPYGVIPSLLLRRASQNGIR